MNIRFHSVVLMVDDFDRMKQFYHHILQQEITADYGNCISFNGGLSLWKLQSEYPIARLQGHTYNAEGNNNLEVCFETDNWEAVIERLELLDLKYLHQEVEEPWGQRTIRFFDPENNLVEMGESVPCFVKRFYNQGMTLEIVSQRTSVPLSMVRAICEALK